ncbi:MAG TPA: hypothetical protein VJL31_08185 [Gemmatimonadales bacterium]|jgi:hypothetical protein|nr:hypothetical protein [Gemmatimonadales bacterium]
MKWLALAGLGVLTACSGPTLDTRTFELKYLRGEEARDIIRPYVFDDRPDAPGQISHQGPLITVRETPDNLEKIGRVLTQYDRPAPSVQLHFQIIQADGATRSDPAIAEVEDALRKLFRFRGYRLVAEALVSGTEFSESAQEIAGVGGPYTIVAHIADVSGSADSGIVRLEASLVIPRVGQALRASVSLRTGQTAVLGNARLNPEGGTVILAVRPELIQH